MFDWADFASIVASFANAAAVAYAAWIARSGLNQWHKERVHTRQAELAEQALAMAYRAQDIFDSVRSIIGFQGEGGSRQKEANETDEERAARDSLFIPIERLNRHAGFFEDVINIRSNFKAAFGNNSSSPLDEILRLRAEIVSNVRLRSTFSVAREFQSRDAIEKHRKRLDELESWYWKGMIEPDPVDTRLVAARTELEKMTGPILESKFRLKER